MFRRSHLPPINDIKAKRKLKLMNRPSTIRLHLGQRKETEYKNNYIPVYNTHTYNKWRTSENRGTFNPDHDDYLELGSIIKYIALSIIFTFYKITK